MLLPSLSFFPCLNCLYIHFLGIHSSDADQKKQIGWPLPLPVTMLLSSVSSADMEMEDDLFFADLTKQISLLIMDDDDDPLSLTPPPLSLQVYSRRVHPPARLPLMREQQAWQRESKGTGVFIPRSLHTRRKNRNGKFNSQNSKINRQSDSRQKVYLPPRNAKDFQCL